MNSFCDEIKTLVPDYKEKLQNFTSQLSCESLLEMESVKASLKQCEILNENFQNELKMFGNLSLPARSTNKSTEKEFLFKKSDPKFSKYSDSLSQVKKTLSVYKRDSEGLKSTVIHPTPVGRVQPSKYKSGVSRELQTKRKKEERADSDEEEIGEWMNYIFEMWFQAARSTGSVRTFTTHASMVFCLCVICTSNILPLYLNLTQKIDWINGYF